MDKYCTDCGEGPLPKQNKSGFCRKHYEKNRPRMVKGTPEYEQERVRTKKSYADNLAQRRHHPKLYKYGLSLEQYNQMVQEQGGRCAICKRTPEEFDGVLAIDHNHSCCKTSRENPRTCGKCVRGLLCRGCNQGIGNFCEDVSALRAAISYIERYQSA